jgi:hypothetical protein
MKRILCCLAAWMFTVVVAISAFAAEAEKYTLRYHFHPDETLRWEVEHHSKVRTTVSGSTQTVETVTTSLKAWRLSEVQPDGTAIFQHSFEWIDMRNSLAGGEEVRYNSRTDAKPPAAFEDTAKRVGVPLSTITMDAKGKVLKRQDTKPRQAAAANKSPAQDEGWMAVPLPEAPVAIGGNWSLPVDIEIPLEGGTVKKIKAVQQFVLEEVKTGVATIRVSTDILTPITDAAVESLLVQRESAGRVRFDIDAGRIIGLQMDIDKHVVGFRGEASSIHYLNRLSEQLVPEEVRTAEKAGMRDNR